MPLDMLGEMNTMELLINNFSIGGYRSFGKTTQRFDKLAQINLFIGQNNCGKSNILRFLHEIYPRLSNNSSSSINLSHLDQHQPIGASFSTGIAISTHTDKLGQHPDIHKNYSDALPETYEKHDLLDSILRLLKKKSELDGTDKYAWFDFSAQKTLIPGNWIEAFKPLDDGRLRSLWNGLTNRQGGDRVHSWQPETLSRIAPHFNAVAVKLIPAIRQIGKQGSSSEEFSGEGIIDRLAKLQNPDIQNQKDKAKFDRINIFLRNVIGNESATIEIPHARDTIHVHMNGKTLPIDSLGTGVHEVIILAAASTILERNIICMEEPELHLNPLLQKKLMRYLLEATSNQYFITTHSAALMDTPSAEIYHISIADGESIAERATSDKQRSTICEDLGYHPSDLLQTNCIIWVEGPSDRIYINYWIASLAQNLIEGIHYSIMFYGGRLASHLTGEDMDKSLNDFISLRRLNRRSAIVIDSDKAAKRASINSTKQRLQSEFDSGPGHTWITEGREIENYLNSDLVKEAIHKTYPSAKSTSTFGQYDKLLAISTKGNKDTQASKVEVARYIIENHPADLNVLDLRKQVQKLVEFINSSNPSTHISEK